MVLFNPLRLDRGGKVHATPSPPQDSEANLSAPPRMAKNEDIQILRGLAVTQMVLFHSGVVPLPAGYLGLDIFFVISGFLITSHIIRDLNRKAFVLPQFYMRRARRPLPAA